MYKIDLPVEQKEAAAIQLRRQREEERKQRIFDSRQRVIGLDLETLKQQVAEKQQRDKQEQDFERAAQLEALRQDKVRQLLHKRQQDDIRALKESDNEFRATQQRYENRREFDLNDKALLKTSRPIRHEENESELGPSSLQIFHGEDAENKDRTKLQKEQQRAWIHQQKEEKRRLQEEQDRLEQLHQLREQETNVKLSMLRANQHNNQKEMLRAQAEYNYALAEQQKALRQSQKAQEQQDNLAHFANFGNSALMTEAHTQAAPTSPNSVKVLPDRYKGMTPEEREAYRQAQIQQMAENEQIRQEAERKRQLEAEYITTLQKTITLMDRQQERHRKSALKDQAALNAQIAEIQRVNNMTRTKDSRNEISDDFHAQFNTTTR